MIKEENKLLVVIHTQKQGWYFPDCSQFHISVKLDYWKSTLGGREGEEASPLFLPEASFVHCERLQYLRPVPEVSLLQPTGLNFTDQKGRKGKGNLTKGHISISPHT